MLNKYIANFKSLEISEINYLATAIETAHPEFVAQQGGEYEDGEELFHHCDSHGLDQAMVVMSLAKDPSAIAVSILEKLVGQKMRREIQKEVGAVKPARGPRKAAQKTSDPRPITKVMANPKKKGSKSYDRFELYKEGMTVNDALAAGVLRADIAYDSERGYITIGDQS